MNKEIKERLEESLEYEFSLSFNERKRLLDYITNLQEENEHLQKQNKGLHNLIIQYIDKEDNLIDISLLDENSKLQDILKNRDEYAYGLEVENERLKKEIEKCKEKIKMKMINPNILNEDNHMEVLEDNVDEMEMIVRCNNCGKPTKYGETRMCSDFVGCDNKMKVNGKEVECYFGDLMPRIMKSKQDYYDNGMKDENNYYHTGKVYRWRDGADGGLNE